MVEPDPESEIEVNLQTVCDGETRLLKTLADLRSFLSEYSAFYSFINSNDLALNQQLFTQVSQWIRTLNSLSNNIGSWEVNNNSRNGIRQQVTAVLNADTQQCLPHHTSVRAQTIKRIWEEHGAFAGAGATALATNQQVGSVWSNREAIKGALAFVLADPSLENTATRDAAAALADTQNRFENARDELFTQTELGQRELEELLEVQKGLNESARGWLSHGVQTLGVDLDRRATEAIDSIKETEKIYKEYMKLEAPRQYWANKATKHEGNITTFGGIALGWLVVVGGFVSLILWSLLPSGISECNVSSLDVLRLWAQPEAKALECTPGGASLWNYAPRAAIGLILTTVFFWIARLLVRLWLSEIHLGMDARERVVMMESYLALKSEGHVQDEDRSLILTPLFRPTQDGIVKDDAAVDPSMIGLIKNLRNS